MINYLWWTAASNILAAMLRLWFCFLLPVFAAHAASISTTTATCNGATTTSSTSASCGNGAATSADSFVNNNFVQALAGAMGQRESAAATAEFQDDLVFTVTKGPAQGFFLPCLDVEADWFQGEAGAGAAFGISVGTPFEGSFGTCGGFLGFPPPQSFTLGVPQTETLSLSAYAEAGSFDPSLQAQAGASAALDGFFFFDSSMNPVSGVTYSLAEEPLVAVPEPATGLLLLSVLVFFCRMNDPRKRPSEK